jgi:D-sedoheptulose 7-phosphate isomerase
LYALAHNIFTAWQLGKTVYTCGNGGSYSNAQHLAQDLEKGTWTLPQPRLKAYHLGGNPSMLTAYANDSSYPSVFSADLMARGQQGDLLIAISGSGNSPNVLNAVSIAQELEMRTWGVTGFSGGKLGYNAHQHLNVPCGNMGMVEAVHGILFHWLVDYVRKAIEASAQHRLDELVTWVPSP